MNTPARSRAGTRDFEVALPAPLFGSNLPKNGSQNSLARQISESSVPPAPMPKSEFEKEKRGLKAFGASLKNFFGGGKKKEYNIIIYLILFQFGLKSL